MKKITLSIFISLFSFVGIAQWQQLDEPNGGFVNDLVTLNDDVFVGTSTGIYKSENNGTTWLSINEGLPKNFFIQVLVHDGISLYAGLNDNGIYKLVNGEGTWEPLNVGIESTPVNSLYVTGDTILAGNGFGGILYSNNAGQTWSNVSNPNNEYFQGFTKFNDKLYAAGSSLFESSDNGASWTEVIVPNLGPNGLRSIFSDASHMYLGGDGQVFVSSDANTWSEQNLSTFSSILSIDGDENLVYLSSGNQVFQSIDNGVIWTQVGELSNSFLINDLKLQNGVFLAGTSKGVYKSSEDVSSWSFSSNGIISFRTNALFVEGTEIFLSAENFGLFYSNDSGQSWELRNNGLPSLSAQFINKIIEVDNTVYLSTNDGIYSSADKGLNWTKRFEPSVSFGTTDIVYDNGTFVLTVPGSEIFVSTDQMDTWQAKQITNLGGQTNFDALVLKDDIIVVATSTIQILISNDLGDTWEDISIPNSFLSFNDFKFVENNLLAATSRGVFITLDLGQTWLQFNGLQDENFKEIEVKEGMIYGATNSGLFATSLDLTGWFPFNESLETIINEIEINDSEVIAGTFGTGIWKLPKDQIVLPENARPFVTTWKTDNPGISNNNQVAIPTYQSNPFETPLYYYYSVDWGDGSTSENLTESITHTYDTAGIYTISISGSFPRIHFDNFNDQTDNQKILSIEQWGDTGWISMSGAFKDCINLNVVATDIPNFGSLTDLGQMFEGCSSLVGNASFDNWDLSTVTSTSGMFNGAISFNQPIGSWDVSNVGQMFSMFRNTNVFNQPIGSWDVSKVEYMGQMFLQSSFNQDISEWDVGKVIGFGGMFVQNTSFNQDISSWDVGSAKFMGDMFHGASSFNQDISLWEVSNVTEMNQMFLSASAFDQNLGNWNVSQVRSMSSMFNSSGISNDNYDNILIGWGSRSNLQQEVVLGAFGKQYCPGGPSRQNLIAIYNWTIDDSGLLSNCDISQKRPFVTTWITNTDAAPNNSMITLPAVEGVTYDYAVNWGDGTVSENITGPISHTYEIPGEYTVSISGDFPRIRFELGGDNSKLIRSIDQWGDIEWTSMEGAFADCSNLQIKANDFPDLSAVTSTNKMFANCLVLSGNGSLQNWNTTPIIDMGEMFLNTLMFNSNLSDWDVSNVQSMNGMFANSGFDQSLGNWNIGQVSSMETMFLGTSLSTVNYDNTLVGWSRLPLLQLELTFDAGGSQFCLAEEARQAIVDTYNWTINDADINCPEESPFVTTWKTDNPGLSEDNQIAIPISGGPFTIDWGDGNITTDESSRPTHTYETPGVYTVSVTGNILSVFFNGFIGGEAFNDASKILEVNQWGSSEWTGMSSGFAGCVNLDIVAIDAPNLSKLTSLFSTFDNCKSLMGNPSFNDWDVSTIEDFSQTFSECSAFNSKISDWDVSSARTVFYMFSGASQFNQNISNWNIGNISNMQGLFRGTSNFNINLSNWDVSGVTNMFQMFESSAFNQDISGWNVSNVTSMGFMFSNNVVFNQDIGSWNTSKVESMNAMFQSSVFNQDISGWDVSSVSDMSFMFGNSRRFNQDIDSWDVSNVENMEFMFVFSREFNQSLASWDMGKVTKMEKMLENSSLSNENYDKTLIGWSALPNLQRAVQLDAPSKQYCQAKEARQSILDTYGWTINDGGKAENCQRPFITTWKTDNRGEGDDNQIVIPTFPGETYNYFIDWGDGTSSANLTGNRTHTYDTPGTYRVTISGDFPRIYFGSLFDQSKLLSIDQWGDIEWTNMESAFRFNDRLIIKAFDVPNLTKVTSLVSMFSGCTSLTDSNLSLNSWNVSGIENMSNMFAASGFNNNIANWDVSSVIDMSNMFGLSGFNQDISNWNVGKVTNMRGMFSDSEFDYSLENWNVTNVISMQGIFGGFNFLSNENYDKTLIGWSELPSLQNNVQLDAPQNEFCQSEEARQSIIDTYGWTINDAGKEEGCDIDCPDALVNEDSSIVLPTGSSVGGVDAITGTETDTNGSTCAVWVTNNDAGQPWGRYRIPITLSDYDIVVGNELLIKVDGKDGTGNARIEVNQDDTPNTALASGNFDASWSTFETTVTVPSGITTIDLWFFSNYADSSSGGTAVYENLTVTNLSSQPKLPSVEQLFFMVGEEASGVPITQIKEVIDGTNIDPLNDAGGFDWDLRAEVNELTQSVVFELTGELSSITTDTTLPTYYRNGDGSLLDAIYDALPSGFYQLIVTPYSAGFGTGEAGESLTINFTVDVREDFQVSADPLTGLAPLEVQFAGSNVTDYDGISSVLWDFGTGDTSSEVDPIYTYTTPGVYEASMTKTDNLGFVTTSLPLTINVESNDVECPDALVNEDPSIVLPAGSAVGGIDAVTGTDTDTNGSPCAVAVTNNDAGQPWGRYRIPITLSDYGIAPGDELLIEVDGKDGTGNARIEVNQDNTPNTALAFGEFGTDWSTFSSTVTVPSGITTVDLWFFSNYADSSSGGTAVYDNLTVTNLSAGGNLSPLADAGLDQFLEDTDGSGFEDVTLDGSGSSDGDGSIVSYSWSDVSGELATGIAPTLVFSVGTSVLTLTVTDDDGGTGTDTVTVIVNDTDPVECPDALENEDPSIVLPAGIAVGGIDEVIGTDMDTNGSPCAIEVTNNDAGQPWGRYRIPITLSDYGIAPGDELFLEVDGKDGTGNARIEVNQDNAPNTALSFGNFGSGWSTFETTVIVPSGITTIDLWFFSNYADSSSGGTAVYDNLVVTNLSGCATPLETYYADSDGDGFGDAGNSIESCEQPTGYVTDSTDCDDTEADTYPGAPEICDGKDNNCNGDTDEGFTDPIINAVVSDNLSDCSLSDGQISIGATFNPVPGIEFSIDGGSSYQSSNTFSNLGNGRYNVIIRNIGGCNEVSYESNPVIIEGPSGPCTVECPDALVNEDPSIVLPAGSAVGGIDAVTGTDTDTNGSPCAVAVTNNDAGQPWGRYRIPITLSDYGIAPGDELLIEVDGKDGTGNARIEVNQDNTPNTALAFGEFGTDWSTFSSTVTVPSGITTVDLWFFSNYADSSSGGTAVYDNLVVTNLSAVPPPSILPLNAMLLSPNPAVESITISFEQKTQVSEYQVFDLLGRLVRTVRATNQDGQQLEVLDLPSGTYFVKTTDSKGQQFQKQMVIKR